ncbi:MAG TPA: hypothetical protein VJI75_00560 [Candidatus Nanoarchaeia archaeon]|nr:hypothetical protein [Candidatus Nanoarchaeia archaeon]
MAKLKGRTAAVKKSRLKLFGVIPKTEKQKRFMQAFILIKTVIYLIIFALVILFLYGLKRIS